MLKRTRKCYFFKILMVAFIMILGAWWSYTTFINLSYVDYEVTIDCTYFNGCKDPIGTLFQIEDSEGSGLLVGSGFVYSINSRNPHRNLLQVFIKKNNPDLTIREMGSPFDSSANISLSIDRGNLVATNNFNNQKSLLSQRLEQVLLNRIIGRVC